MNVMFDLYGTLIDIHTDEEKDIFWIKLAKSLRKYKKYDYLTLKKEYLNYVKLLETDIEEIEIREVFKHLFNTNAKITDKICKIFRKLSTEYIKLYNGVKRLLKSLKKENIKLYVLSNAQNAFTIPELKKLGIYKLFDGIAISSDYKCKKPNKNFFKNAMKSFKIDIDDTMMIGNDYDCDIAPSIELGLNYIFIESNLTPKNNFSKKIIGFDEAEIFNIIIKNRSRKEECL